MLHSRYSSCSMLMVGSLKLGGVGLDVFPNEPEVNPRLLQFPNATLLPHMGTETCDSQKKMEVRALTNLRDFVAKGKGSDIIPEHQQYVHVPSVCAGWIV